MHSVYKRQLLIMGIFSGSLDCPLYTGLTVLYIQAWLSFICRFDCPLHTGLTVLYIQVWLSFTYRFDCPLYTGLTVLYIQVWLSFIYRFYCPLYTGLTVLYIQVWFLQVIIQWNLSKLNLLVFRIDRYSVYTGSINKD